MAKGEIIVEGAKCFCSRAVVNNNKSKTVPLAVKSQIANLKANKYFAQEKPIATNLDNSAKSFGAEDGFGECKGADNKSYPCKPNCKITYKNYYENVDFNKSMKVLLNISTGTCLGYGVTGNIEFATTGQKKGANTIDVKEADPFTVTNISGQWEVPNPTKGDSVSKISMTLPFVEEEPTGKYYFIEKAVNPAGTPSTSTFPHSVPWPPAQKQAEETQLNLKATYTGDPTKIMWALFKGENTKDKVKTFVGIGANVSFALEKLFKDQEEGVYRIEAYCKIPGSEKCFILIDYLKDRVEGITAPGNTLLKNTLIPLTVKFKATTIIDKLKTLNFSGSMFQNVIPIASWRIISEKIVIYNSENQQDSTLVKVEAKTGALAVFSFRNPGEYQIEAYTSPDNTKPIKITLKVLESLGINTVKATCNQLLRYNENLKVEVSKYNVDFLPVNSDKMQWYLQKDKVRLRTFESSDLSKEKSINKPIKDILFDANRSANCYGKYVIEGYAKPGEPNFLGSDSFSFEVIRNHADKIILPASIIKGAKVKYEFSAKIMPLESFEEINLKLPEGIVNNHDGTLTFTREGAFEIAACLTGNETLDTNVKAKIKVAAPELKRALWAYGTGYKRIETGYKEETHAFVEITGLENQAITIKVWVRGTNESFYLEPETYLLEEKKITLDNKGKGSFKITTDEKYKEKINKALPSTTETPNPNISLIFTVEMPTGSQGAITLPDDMAIKNGKPVIGTKFIEVLDSNEELAVTSNKNIKSIFFSTEDGKGVQQTLTHQNKKHKIWVHTANMQEEELRVEVMAFVHSDCMEEKDGTITALQSIKSYQEKVGNDGLLELSFTAEEKDLTDAEANPVRFAIQVSRKVKDPNDDKKEVYVFEDDQLVILPHPNVRVVRSPDMKSVGIKATKQDGTSFTKEEKIELRKQLICFKNTALMVQKGILTEEAIENCTVPIMVDLEMAEVQTNEVCACKENNFYWSSRITCDERKKVLEVCANIWGEENKIEKASMLMSIMHLETGKTFSPSQKGVSSSGTKYIGLVQFSATTAQSLGTTYDALGEMTFIKQLEYVEKYLKQNKDKMTTLTDFYLQVLLPSHVGHGSEPNYIVFNESITVPDNGIESSLEKRKANITKHPWVTKYGYASNAPFMKETGEHENSRQAWHYSSQSYKTRRGFKNGKTYMWEVTKVVTEDHYIPGKNEIFIGSCRNATNLELSGRAPWMEVAVTEAKKYGGKKQDIIQSRVTLYHKEGANYNVGTDAWCSSFACWCLENSSPKYNSPHSAGSRSFIDHKTVIRSEVFFGAIATFSDCSKDGVVESSGHVTFVYGKLADEKYAVLGGNQGGMIKVSPYDCSGNVFYSHYSSKRKREIYKKFIGFFKPIDFEIKNIDKLTESDNYLSVDDANKKIGLGEVKTVSGEKDD
ncbi:PAAR-like protein [Flavobacterium branchiicola]|uniref:PAAR-like protein n=1 Tax=Flavobacterium branchiicola TaxID=1114875 RepID=A0ABV9PGY6_9FLAO|nr:PAAR-like protein [Flavobacterium branchiicola]MBS7255111.1 DUF4280 domain-containing protein [Flavobacterium branchiicola]